MADMSNKKRHRKILILKLYKLKQPIFKGAHNKCIESRISFDENSHFSAATRRISTMCHRCDTKEMLKPPYTFYGSSVKNTEPICFFLARPLQIAFTYFEGSEEGSHFKHKRMEVVSFGTNQIFGIIWYKRG